MFHTLKNKNLNQQFINSLITMSNFENIEDWFLIYENFYAGMDHNGNNSLDCTYILTDPMHNKVAIYYSQFDNNLEISKNIEIVPFHTALEGNIHFDKMSKISFSQKIKEFQLSFLNYSLSHSLEEKKIIDKKSKI